MEIMDKDKIEDFVSTLYECFRQGSRSGYAKVLDQLMDYRAFDAATVVKKTILRVLDQSYHYGDNISVLMVMAIRKNKEWALVNGYRNPLVESIIQSGSMYLYECYTEEVDGLTDEWYTALLMNMVKMNAQVLASYDYIYRTIHFTSGVREDGYRRLDEDDYQELFLATQRYNRLVGMSKIIMRLNKIVNRNIE